MSSWNTITQPDLSVNSDNDNNVIDETAVVVSAGLMQGDLKEFYNNQSQLIAELKIAYIVLQMTDFENKKMQRSTHELPPL